MTDFPSSPVTARAKLLEELERATYVTLHGVNWTLGLGTADQQALIDALRTSGHAQTPADRAAIIEECAKVCEDLRHEDYSCETSEWSGGTFDCARAIRSLSGTSTGRQSGPTPGFRLIEEPCEHHHCEFPSCGCEVPISSPIREAGK